MNAVKKVILAIKNKFVKQDKVKKLTEPAVVVNEDKKESFIESLKTKTVQNRIKKRVETLTCDGDGLGIQTKITY